MAIRVLVEYQDEGPKDVGQEFHNKVDAMKYIKKSYKGPLGLCQMMWLVEDDRATYIPPKRK